MKFYNFIPKAKFALFAAFIAFVICWQVYGYSPSYWMIYIPCAFLAWEWIWDLAISFIFDRKIEKFKETAKEIDLDEIFQEILDDNKDKK
jgi:hypothetical protein